MGLTKDSSIQQVENYIFTCRLVLSILTGCIIGILPYQTYLYALALTFPLMFPMRAVAVNTQMDVNQLFKHGMFQSIAGFLLGWLTTYNLRLQGFF